MAYRIVSVSYNNIYKVIGKHPDGRIFATRHDGTAGLYVVDRNLNYVSTLNTTLPSDINNCLILSTGTMIAWGTYSYIGYNKQTYIYRSTDTTYAAFTVVLTLDPDQQLIERSLDVSTKDDTLMLNEYTSTAPITYDDHREPLQQKIWMGKNDGQTWTSVFTINRNAQFEGDTEVVRHLHAVCYDPYADKFWFSSGDGARGYGFENKIWYINPDGIGVTKVGEGEINSLSAPANEWYGQRWRTTAFVFTPDYVIYGTDTTYTDQSWYIRIKRSSIGNVLERDLLTKNNDCCRIARRVQTTWGDIFVSQKSNEKSTENPNRDSRLNICHDLQGGTNWYEAYRWYPANTDDISVFYNLIDGRDNRLYGQAYRNLLDENGQQVPYTGLFTTVVMDILQVVSTPTITQSDQAYTAQTRIQDTTAEATKTTYYSTDNANWM